MNDVAIGNIEKLIEMYRSKVSLSDIGSVFGMKVQVTGTLIKSLIKIEVITDEDIKERKGKTKQDISRELKQRNEEIVRDYENFVDIKDICETYGITETTMRSVVRNSGVKLNNRKYRNLEYPQNLIFDIFGGVHFETTEDNKNGLYYSLNFLNNREKKVILDYYKEEATLESISSELEVCKERIRQIRRKALRKLRSPIISKYILYGYEKYSKMLEEQEIQRKEKIGGTGDILIEELGLSIRPYNCLKRCGINKVADIKSSMQLMRVRNLGRKSLNELLEKLQEIGYEMQECESECDSD